MQLSTFSFMLVVSTSPVVVIAKIIPIRSVAEAPFFDPTNTTADAGDILEFHFSAHNRSVVMGDWDKPCQPAATGGFYSGFFTESDTTTENPTVFRVTVNDTNPIVYYCSQNGADYGNHCKSGMAGIINEPDLTKLLSYQDAAAFVNTSVTPASQPFGGIFVANPDTDAVNGNSTTMTSSATTRAFGQPKFRSCWVLSTCLMVIMMACC